ncbi:MAG TPA: hypothetical protein VNC50_09880, partial [Planctomycetia bacterium]|nr:hypothetical protein [Planctomycetia bacterium]
LDNLAAAGRQSPGEPGLKLLRSKVLRRAGEYTAAADLHASLKADGKTDVETLIEASLARYQAQLLHLGNLAEPLIRPTVSDELAALLAVMEKLKAPEKKAPAVKGGKSPPSAAPAEKDPRDIAVYIARLLGPLVRHDAEAAGDFAFKNPPPPTGDPSLDSDLRMLRIDMLLGGAETALAKADLARGDGKNKHQKNREDWANKATAALREGLGADENHVGLLFLKANSQQQRAVWGSEADGQSELRRKNRPNFETAFYRMRSATPSRGPDAAVARAVLLANFERPDPAVDVLADAIIVRQSNANWLCFRIWLNLVNPPSGQLDASQVKSLRDELNQIFETPPETPPPYVLRALAYAAVGEWEAARSDLRNYRKKLKVPVPPTVDPVFQTWIDSAEGSTVRFLDATIAVLWRLPTPVDNRIRFAEAALKRIDEAPPPNSKPIEILTDTEKRDLRAVAHWRLARFWAETDKEQKRVLAHLRLALEQNSVEMTLQRLRSDEALRAFMDDSEFAKALAAPKG